MQSKRSIGIAVLLSVTAVWAAGQTHSGAGTTAFPFLSGTYDARSIGLGNASAGVPNGLYGAISNPAALGFITRQQVMLGYRPTFVDLGVAGSPVGYAYPEVIAGESYVVGLLLLPFNYGRIEEFNEERISTGVTWRSYSVTGGISLARIILPDLGVGATLKGIYDRMGSSDEHFSSTGLAIDLGAQYRMMKGRFVCGVALSNAGVMISPYSPGAERAPLPLTVTAGLSYAPEASPYSRIAFDISKGHGDFLNYRPGMELNLYQGMVLGRIGYSFSHRDLQEAFAFLRGDADDDYQKTSMSGLALGVGVIPSIPGVETQIDAAIELRSPGAGPTFTLSGIVGF